MVRVGTKQYLKKKKNGGLYHLEKCIGINLIPVTVGQ
jgi:hypothetical protein